MKPEVLPAHAGHLTDTLDHARIFKRRQSEVEVAMNLEHHDPCLPSAQKVSTRTFMSRQPQSVLSTFPAARTDADNFGHESKLSFEGAGTEPWSGFISCDGLPREVSEQPIGHQSPIEMNGSGIGPNVDDSIVEASGAEAEVGARITKSSAASQQQTETIGSADVALLECASPGFPELSDSGRGREFSISCFSSLSSAGLPTIRDFTPEQMSNITSYIPVGCITISQEGALLSKEESDASKNCWILLPAYNDGRECNILGSTALQFCRALHLASWIKLAYTTGYSKDEILLRVYVLPDDALRRTVDRSDRALRKALLKVLICLDTSVSRWQGQHSTSNPPSPRHEADNSKESPTLFQLFNNLPSPQPDPSYIRDIHDAEAMEDILSGEVIGLKTKMFPYQRRSAAMMLQRESLPTMVVDPRLVKQTDCNGQPYYRDLIHGTILREPRLYEGPRGGINAETMGLGKTLISLALILATRDLGATVPIEYSVGTIPKRPKVGSLLDMCGSAAGRSNVPWRRFLREAGENGSALTNCAEAIKRGGGRYFIPQNTSTRESRHAVVKPSKRIVLSAATLVVVPHNLVRQWESEIDKHTSTLDVLVVRDAKDKLPQAEELARFDIILFSRHRFEVEAKHGLNDYGRRSTNGPRYCYNCSSLQCQCENADSFYHSPLTDIHFKRLITDEGHTLGASSSRSSSNAVIVADFIRVDARWIISGTPTPGLYGQDVMPTAEQNEVGKTNSDQNFNFSQEHIDLQKLGNIAKVYLKARPWAATHAGDTDVADWSTYVMQPEHRSGSKGNLSCLKNTLENMIIRHRQEDVENDIQLPPLYQRLVFLDPSYIDKLNLNLFALMITSNAVTSDRQDEDYFFHESQRKLLLSLVQNLRQSSFFWSGFSHDDISSAVRIIKDFLQAGEIKTSEDDRVRLETGVTIGNLALQNTTWSAASHYHEMPVRVKNAFPKKVRQALALNTFGEDPTLLSASSLGCLQHWAVELRQEDQQQSSETLHARLVRLGEDTRRAATDALAPAAPRTAGKLKKVEKLMAGRATTLAGCAGVGAEPPIKNKVQFTTPPSTLSKVRRRSATDIDEESPSKRQKTNGDMSKMDAEDADRTDAMRAINAAQLVSTASAKLSYLLDQVASYAHDEKIIIFYEAENVAYYIAQGLDLICVEHLIYAKSLTTDRRSRYLLTFNQSPKFRVLLMDISQAAFGLDIKVASRVYFVNPVLSLQVEAQAIKRAHRIGQTRPVYIETLVLNHSIEQAIVARRQEMTDEEQNKVKGVLEDNKLYEWVRNIEFTGMERENKCTAAQMARLQCPQPACPQSVIKHTPDEGLIGDWSPERKTKTKTGGISRSSRKSDSGVSRERRKAGQPVYTDESGIRYWLDSQGTRRPIKAGTRVPVKDLRTVPEEHA